MFIEAVQHPRVCVWSVDRFVLLLLAVYDALQILFILGLRI